MFFLYQKKCSKTSTNDNAFNKSFLLCWKSYLALCLHRICLVKADVVPDLSTMCLAPVQNLHFALCFLFPAAWSSYSLWFSYPNLIIAESLDILKKVTIWLECKPALVGYHCNVWKNETESFVLSACRARFCLFCYRTIAEVLLLMIKGLKWIKICAPKSVKG